MHEKKRINFISISEKSYGENVLVGRLSRKHASC